MSEEFKEYVTSTAFHLSLSRDMCATLIAIRDGGMRFSADFGRFVPTVKSLIKRGLVDHHYNGVIRQGKKVHYTMTKAGDLTAGLIDICGIVAAAPKKRKAA